MFVFKPGGVLVVSDLFWNYPASGASPGTRLWKFGMDRLYAPFYLNFMINDKGAIPLAPRGLPTLDALDPLPACKK